MSAVAEAITYFERDGITVPTKFAVCPQCEGKGTSTAYLGAFTREEMDEDPEFFEDYMAGHYDRACDTCRGQRVVREPNLDAMTATFRAEFEQAVSEYAEMRAAEEAERRMGA